MLEVDIRKRVGEFELDVEFSAPAGFTVLYGPSGSGKTTILDCLAGTRRPDQGRIDLDGEPVFSASHGIDRPAHERRMPRVFQEGRLFPHMSVRQNLLYGNGDGDGRSRGGAATPGNEGNLAGSNDGTVARADLDEVAGILEIGEFLDRSPADLSGGERQRVAVGRALLARPRALLLDEPLAALDAPLRGRILPHLRRLQERFAIPFVYVTHSIEEALALADQAVLLESGRIRSMGRPGPVLAHGPGAPSPPVEAGDSLLEVDVLAHHEAEGITDCAFGDCVLRSLRLDEAVGDRLFLSLSPRDVILARQRPEGLSARNALAASIVDIHEAERRLLVAVRFRGSPADAPTVLVAVTPDAANEMALARGNDVWCLFKSSALRPVAPGGRTHRRDR